jgi:BirA family biotin operon repressor/biotin-[acetyl-CoA-carboxylase] ligase
MHSATFDLARIATESGVAALEFQPEVGSTNDWALALAAEEGRAWPLLVLTEKQTGGRGRGANRWWSAEGALTFSLVVDASRWTLAPDRWPQAALAAGLAACTALHALYPPGAFALKWPNDVYLSGRKLCGILVEMPAPIRGRLVVGVGINVNNSFVSAPEELRQTATSLADVAGGCFDLSDILVAVVKRLAQTVSSSPDLSGIAAELQRYSLLTGKTVQVAAGREVLSGRCLGLADDGALRVQTEKGERRLHAGTVVHWE